MSTCVLALIDGAQPPCATSWRDCRKAASQIRALTTAPNTCMCITCCRAKLPKLPGGGAGVL